MKPPEEMREAYRDLGLEKNKDVLEKGNEYVDNLAKGAKEHEELAKDLDRKAEQAEQAAKKMQQFSNTLADRDTKIHSVDQNSLLRPNVDHTAASQASNGVDAKNFDAARVAGNQAAPQAKGQSETKSGSVSAPSYFGSDEGDPKAKKLDSLAERLKEALGRAPASLIPPKGMGPDVEAELAAKRELEKLTQGAASETGQIKLSENSQSENARFRLSGSETDAAIRRLTAGLNDQGSAIYGSVDQSIFQRMSKYYVKAQQDKKISR